MSKAVFTTKVGSGYDDVVELRYHFPETYLRAVEATIGDQIIYYEPRRGSGQMAYFAVAQVTGVRADRLRAGHYYADLAGYLDFDRKVPFVEGSLYYERQLQKADGSTSKGAFGRAVRPLADDEFMAIRSAGFAAAAPWPEPDADENPASYVGGFGEEAQTPFEIERPTVTMTRAFRDRRFARHVQIAYDRTCAVTGLRLLNGGGRPEVQAAHIMPVADNGPDSVRNGVALSGTMHWLFDRGLMTFEDDGEIVTVASGIPDELRRLINPARRLIVPKSRDSQPSPAFLRYHREHVFKG
jgi:putative restriction endonuclease